MRDLNRATETTEAELERLRHRQSRIKELERDRDALLKSYASIIPKQLDALLPEERHRIYKMLNLSVIGHRDGGIEITWAWEGPSPDRSNDGTTLPGSSNSTTAFGFRAVLIGDGEGLEVEPPGVVAGDFGGVT